MPHQWEQDDRREFFRNAMVALWANRIQGDYVEFGCFEAQTFRMAYQESRGVHYQPKMWAFDSFEGFPDAPNEHPAWSPGRLAMSQDEFVRVLDEHQIPRDVYTMVKGFYNESLFTPEAENYCRNICMAYVDCDQYGSAVDVLKFLRPRLKHGMVIVLDDYYCFWTDGIAGERLAFLEMAREVERDFNFLPWMRVGWGGQSFIVESRSLLRFPAVGHF
jgi:O-methyltransferase